MTAPVPISSTATVFNTNTTPKTTASIAVQSGDVLVASAFGELAQNGGVAVVLAITTATGSTSAWAPREDTSFTDGNHAYIRTWTATATATGNITVSFSQTAGTAINFGGEVSVLRGSGGIGNVNKNNNNISSGAPTISVTTTGANSALVFASTDWNATAGTVTFTASNGTPVSDLADQSGAGASYCNYSFHVADAGAAGAKTMGMSSPSTQRYVCTVIEVLGTASAFIAAKSITLQSVNRAASF